MKKKVSKPEKPLKGSIVVPSDKSISHRAVIFASLAKGRSIIKNFSNGKDPVSSLDVCRALGVDAFWENDLIIKSSGNLKNPSVPLDPAVV